MPDERSCLEAAFVGTAVRFADAAFRRIGEVEASSLPLDGRDAPDMPVCGGGSADDACGEYPGIDAMGFKAFGELVVGFYRAEVVSRLLCFVALHGAECPESSALVVEPLFADFEGAE